ncbi:MAG TPA: hypothetical protein VGL86_24835 [Polyangia bacterium]|jgi:hypothetical protein
MRFGAPATLLLALTAAACSSGNGDGAASVDLGGGALGADLGDVDLAGADLAGADGALPPATLDGNRDRLLASYLAWLHAHPGAQSNGLDGATLGSVCDLWTALAPSDRDVFLTLTARLDGSRLGSDGSAALARVTRLYRIAGGQGATASDAGSCGGGEYNRMIMSMDPTLHDAFVAANDHQGAAGGSGAFDIADVPADSSRFWRDSHDLGGPHAPFDLSDETQDGAPRGQVQYFRDPSSAAANAPLGRMDLTTLVDPDALEMDQDYDCVHNSNPSCSYVTYGPLCAPEASTLGLDLYESSYGAVESGWHPTGC